MSAMPSLITSTSRRRLAHEVEAAIESVLECYGRGFRRFSTQLHVAFADGISPADYSIYRANYVYRTQKTLAMIAKVLCAITSQDRIDQESLVLVRQVFSEESGDGVTPMHVEMLLQSHNLHGSVVFGIPPLEGGEPGTSDDIIAEAREFRRVQSDLYSSASYPRVIGAFLAQEAAAESMLETFFRLFFLPYRDTHYDFTSFQRVERYFSSHLNGVEKEHADRAKRCAARACKNDGDLEELRLGMQGLLTAQANLWSGLIRKIIERRQGDSMRHDVESIAAHGA